SDLVARRTPLLDQLQNRNLVPFRDLVGSGAGELVGRREVPDLTQPSVRAGVGPAAMQLLRKGTGYGAAPFGGPSLSAALCGRAAITDRMSIPEAVEAALVAGADNALWITTDAVPQVLDRLEQAVWSGRLPIAQVDASVLRMAWFKGAPLHC